MQKRIYFLLLLLFCFVIVKGQEYIVFERQKGINAKQLIPDLLLSQNEIELNSGDTILHIFNFYFKMGSSRVIMAGVPIIKPGEKLKLTKIATSELKDLKVITIDSLYKIASEEHYKTIGNFRVNDPPFKTIAYQLIIKDGSSYYKVEQQVLFSRFKVDERLSYFPNEFKNGVLNINPKSKVWRDADLLKISEEMKYSGTWLRAIFDHIYISKVDKNAGFKYPVFTYFEYPNNDVVSTMAKPKILTDDHLGLGSFQYLNEIGIINCTLDYYLKGHLFFDQTPSLRIVAINSLPLVDFRKAYEKEIEDPYIGGDVETLKGN